MAPRKSSIYAGVMAFRDFCKTLNTLNGIGAPWCLIGVIQIGGVIQMKPKKVLGAPWWIAALNGGGAPVQNFCAEKYFGALASCQGTDRV